VVADGDIESDTGEADAVGQLELPIPLARPRRPSRTGDDEWRLDDRTRHVGRMGLQAARAALAGASRPGRRRAA